MPARALFVGGTSSNAGKSWMATALCAWLHRHGVDVAPFKAQNMSNHSFPCRGGGEIGRAQVVQAEACGLVPEPAMNPILLKPSGGSSQVILTGTVWRTLTPRAYYAHAPELREHVLAAYRDLASRHDFIVLEGAGSVCELNLRHADLVNLWLATTLGVPWILVSDVERGGVFGSVCGTVDLLDAPERALLRGFAINKFRGDPSLFEDGPRLIEERTQARCLGVFPFEPDVELDAEDSLSLNVTPTAAVPARGRTAIVRLPALSNGTDFRLLKWAEWVDGPPIGDFDVIVLPGTKGTLAALAWLRRTGLAEWILRQHARGATVVGICGGFQMLGQSIHDPDHVESHVSFAEGLGLLPCTTIMAPQKTTRVRHGVTTGGATFSAYEIHMGRTTCAGDGRPFARLDAGEPEGINMNRVIGTYLHGAFEHPAVCAEVFGVWPADGASGDRYARLADWFERHARNWSPLDLAS
jgi:adenosylcobyric acid synthase